MSPLRKTHPQTEASSSYPREATTERDQKIAPFRATARRQLLECKAAPFRKRRRSLTQTYAAIEHGPSQ